MFGYILCEHVMYRDNDSSDDDDKTGHHDDATRTFPLLNRFFWREEKVEEERHGYMLR